MTGVALELEGLRVPHVLSTVQTNFIYVKTKLMND